MTPITILMDEHRIIEQVLNCLEVMVERCSNDGKLDKADANAAVDFFRNFADRCHHAKEEAHLFTLLEGKGLPRQGGPTGVMLAEHEQGRAHVRGMAEEIENAAAGDAYAVQRFVCHGRGYIELLRGHIQKEDHCLFPIADETFSQDDQAALLSTFQKVETEELEPGTHEKYLRVADKLAERYGVPRTATEARQE